MPNYNKIIMIGHITRDVELRYTPSGAATVKIGIATNYKYKKESGEEREEVCFIDAEIWNKSAETIAQYFKKGDPILVEGRLKLDTWEDKESGAKRSKHVIAVSNWSFVSSAKDAAGSDETQEREERPRAINKPKSTKAPTPPDDSGADDDDCPF